MKKCCTCHVEKEFESFNKDSKKKDGFGYECKDCRSVRYKLKMTPEVREKNRLRCQKHFLKKQKELAKAKLLVNADYKLRQKKAHEKVWHAIRIGKLIKPLICEKCSENKPSQGHHEDYAKPLEVIWLCSICHSKEHSKRRDI